VREDAATKGRRLVAEGRLVLQQLDEHAGTAQATCRGDGATWNLGRDEHGLWYCTCPARSRCSHLYALGLVVALPREARA